MPLAIIVATDPISQHLNQLNLRSTCYQLSRLNLIPLPYPMKPAPPPPKQAARKPAIESATHDTFSTKPQPTPTMLPSPELTEAFKKYRTQLLTAKRLQSRIRKLSMGLDMAEIWKAYHNTNGEQFWERYAEYEVERKGEEERLVLTKERMRDRGMDVVQWTAVRVIGRFLPAELEGMIRDRLGDPSEE